MTTDPETGIFGFWHCQRCFEEKGDESARDFAQLTAGVGAFGELIVFCNRHKHTILQIDNGEIDKALAKMAHTSCDHCEEGEVTH